MNLAHNPSKIFFLGPKGTFTDRAQLAFCDAFSISDAEKIPVCSISKGFDFLLKNKDSLIVLPIENSIEGIVRETLDNLISLDTYDYKILAEHIIPIEQNLIGFTQNPSEIKTIISHPQAIAQCRRFLNSNFPDVEIKYSNSTANAVCSLNKDDISTVAIGSEFCAQIYDVPLIQKNINDEKNNLTRFVLIGNQYIKKQTPSKTAITFTTANTPGALNRILSIFERYNINMTQIESRPSKKSLGNYTFFIEIDGHYQDNLVVKSLFEVIQFTQMFKHLGSYSTV